MDWRSGKPSDAVTYYSRDDLKNFYVRVELQKVTSSRTTNPLLESGGHTRAATPAPTQEKEEWTFQWQQKAFSQHEEEVYADANNCINTVEEQYHRQVLDIRKKGGRPNKRLFSYVDKDGYKKPVTLVTPPLLDCGSEVPTFASTHASGVRKRHISRAKKNLSPTTVRKPVSFEPTDDERLSHRITTIPSQSMFIMADLRKMDGFDLSEEHLLCHITVYANGMVTVKPDFNSGQPAYRLENKHREIFEYRIEHASQPRSTEDIVREKRILSEVYHQHINFLSTRVGKTFLDPPENNALRVLLLGEIVSAKGFEYDDLYVTAHLELPEFWELEDEDCYVSPRSHLPAVVTQISTTRSRHKYNVAHFACPFEFSLVCHAPSLSAPSTAAAGAEAGSLAKWPRVLLEVGSLDGWDRHRVEGYGYMDVPSSPGSYEMSVDTWRPTGRRVVDKLKRFFIGGPPELNDITYVASPSDFHGTHLSRYGFRTETSGSVQLKLNLTHQCRASIRSPEEASSQEKYKGFKGAVASILESYQRARDKALSLTSTLQRGHSEL